MKSKIRSFVAIELPESIRADIRELQRALRSYRFDIRWVEPVNMHLTLTFLGDVDPSGIEAVGRVLSETVACRPVFELVPRGVGVFPNIRQPRVIWAGIAGQTADLRSLRKSVDDALGPLGFEAEDRPYRGHLTLGRVRSRMDHGRLVDALRAYGDFASQAFSVERLMLFKSELHPDGPVYKKLCEMPLGKPPVSTYTR
jgi:2'-5' RNA ligase